MTDRDILIELLAIKLYERDRGTVLPPRPVWMNARQRDQQAYRDLVSKAEAPWELYEMEPRL